MNEEENAIMLQRRIEFLQKENPVYTDIPVLHQQIVPVSELIYEPVAVRKINPVLEFEKTCFIYSASLGVGSLKVFIVSKKRLESSEQILSLKRIFWKEFNKNYLCGAEFEPNYKKFDLNDSDIGKEDMKRSWKELINENVWMFEVLDAIDKRVAFHFLKRYGLKNIISDFFKENAVLDEDILFAFESQLIHANECRPELQRFSSHMLLITGTKTGKTTILEKLGNKYDAAYMAKMIGFGTADSVVHGDIDGMFLPIGFDDINRLSFQECFLDALASLMENGTATVAKGKATLKPKTSSSLILTTNMQKESSSSDFMDTFMKILNALSAMHVRIGSRFSLVIFDDEIKPVRDMENKLTMDDINTNKLLIKIISRHLSDIFRELCYKREVNLWLNSPMKEYQDTIKGFSKELYNDISNFWEAQAEGYRHMRGMALRAGLLEYADKHPEIFDDNYNIIEIAIKKINLTELIELAEDALENIKRRNLKSIHKMIDIKFDVQALYEKQYNSIRQIYVKILLNAIVEYLKDKDEERIFLDSLADEIKTYANLMKVDKYQFVSSIEQSISPKQFTLTASIFGVECIKENGKYHFKISNKEKFAELKEVLQNLGKSGKLGKKEDLLEITKIYPNEDKEKTQNNEELAQYTSESNSPLPVLPELLANGLAIKRFEEAMLTAYNSVKKRLDSVEKSEWFAELVVQSKYEHGYRIPDNEFSKQVFNQISQKWEKDGRIFFPRPDEVQLL